MVTKSGESRLRALRLVRRSRAGVAGEAMVALVLADAFLRKIWRRFARRDAEEFDNYARQSTSSEAREAPDAAAGTVSAARKIYKIVKYGDPILRKTHRAGKTFDSKLKSLPRHVRFHVRAQGVGLAAANRPHPAHGRRRRHRRKKSEAKSSWPIPEVIHARAKSAKKKVAYPFRAFALRHPSQFVTVRAQMPRAKR